VRVLYLSYDGMCDPLGGSQVLPYLFGLAEREHRISLVSFEKADRSEAEREEVRHSCTAAGIDWHPLPYHKRPPLLSSMYDVRRMRRLAARLHRQEGFDLVHCRSYLPALVGLKMKRRFGVPFVFDMRGFWADERVDGRIWNLSNPLFRAVFAYFKRREAELLAEADQVISLTEEGRKILLQRRGGADGPPIAMIPCCVDFDAFPRVTAKVRAASRKVLGIDAKATVAAYLGSWGSWYLTDEMLDFFKVQLERDPAAILLVVSREPRDEIVAEAASRGISPDRVIVRPASRAEVPKLIAAADYGLFFIMPVFSKKASSPTKMGEFLSLELPVVTNGGVGDVERILAETGAGVVARAFDAASYQEALDALAALKPDVKRWRSAARRWFDLATGVERYDHIYDAIAKGSVGRRQVVR
jgi:glycosyltransferase involved in cell wall biosynthesis